jgi:hypothetical protein
MVKTTIAWALGALVLAGCAHPPTFGGREPPGAGRDVRVPPPKCHVNVYVRDDAERHITVDNEPVYPRGCDNGNLVTWQLVTPGYRFDANGISFAKSRKNPPFVCKPRSETEFFCTFPPAERGPYPYDIHVVGPGGLKRNVDPSVMID